MKTLIYILLNIVIVFQACGQTMITIPPEFVETVPPNVGSDQWYTLNHSRNEFGVKIQDGQLEIEKVDEINQCTLKLPHGVLTGINKGEWGGQLTFKPTDTRKKEIAIKEGNIKFLFSYKNNIYFIEGLAHLGYNAGALYELDTTDQRFSFEKLIAFDDAPEAFYIFEDQLLIATHRNFYVVKDFKKELIFKEMFWSSLYPNSIAVHDEKNVFVGIRGGIVKLDLTNKTMKFYKEIN